MPEDQAALQYNIHSNDDTNELEEIFAIPLDDSEAPSVVDEAETLAIPLDVPSPTTSVALCEEAYSPSNTLDN